MAVKSRIDEDSRGSYGTTCGPSMSDWLVEVQIWKLREELYPSMLTVSANTVLAAWRSSVQVVMLRFLDFRRPSQTDFDAGVENWGAIVST